MRAKWWCVGGLLTLGACAGDTSAPDVPVDAFVEVNTTPSQAGAGTVQYEDRPFSADGLGAPTPRPARDIRVELVIGDRVVQETYTDTLGAFAFTTPIEDGTTYEVRAHADVKVGPHGARTADRSSLRRVYTISASAVAPAGVTLLARSDAEGGAFNVVDVAHDAFEIYAPFVDAGGPVLTYRWERGRPFDCGSCYSENEISLGGGTEDTDEYDDDIILHELGHFFVEHFSADSSPAGAHRDRQVEPTLAYGEGVAYFFANLVRDNPIIIDTFEGSTRVIDNENVLQNGVARPDLTGTTDGTSSGRIREEVVASILWDAYDSGDNESFDRVALGRDAMLRLLVDHFGQRLSHDYGARGIDLSDALQALVCVANVPSRDAVALAEARSFPWQPETCAD